MQWIAERREAIDVGQYNEIERERRQVDGQARDAASEHGREGSAAALRQRDAGEERCADQQRLLQDQQEAAGTI